MIKVEKNKRKFEQCASCGTSKNLFDISIKRGPYVNSLCIVLCKKCARMINDGIEE